MLETVYSTASYENNGTPPSIQPYRVDYHPSTGWIDVSGAAWDMEATKRRKSLYWDYLDPRFGLKTKEEVHKAISAKTDRWRKVSGKKQYVLSATKAPLHPSSKTIEEVVVLTRMSRNQCEEVDPRAETQSCFDLGMKSGDHAAILQRKITEHRARPASAAVLQELRAECGKIMTKLHDLESRQRARPNTVASPSILTLEKRKRRTRGLGNQTAKLQTPAEEKDVLIDPVLLAVVDDIQHTLTQLNETIVTNHMDEITVRETHAATLIISIVRAFVHRRRYERAMKAMTRWRRRNGAETLKKKFLETKARLAKLKIRVEVMISKRMETIKAMHFRALLEYSLQTRQVRRVAEKGAEKILGRVHARLVHDVFMKWFQEAIGPGSRKNVKAKYQARYLAAQKTLEDEELAKPEHRRERVTRVRIKALLREQAAEIIQRRKVEMRPRIYFKAWSRDYLHELTQLKRRARRFRAQKHLPLYWKAWIRLVHERSEEATVNRHWRLSRYEPRHNMRRIDNFHRLKTLSKVFQAWHKVYKHIQEVRIRHRNVLHRRKFAIFMAWRKRAKYQHQIKLVCIEEWRDISTRMRKIPFRLWFLRVKHKKQKRQARQILLEAFDRRRQRLLVASVFRNWSHCAIYGKTDGMFSRADLIKALNKQKQLVIAMDAANVQARDSIRELEEQLEKEQQRSLRFKIEVADKTEELIKQKFAQQQLEEEVVRLQGLVDSMSLIHPGTARRLTAAQVKSPQAQRVSFAETGLSNVARNYSMRHGISLLEEDENAGSLVESKPLVPSAGDGDSYLRTRSMPARPSSARLPVMDKPESCASSKKKTQVVWVTQEDAQVIMRAKWAYDKVMELAEREIEEKSGSPKSGNLVEPSGTETSNRFEEEVKRLRSILSFVFIGDLEDIQETIDKRAEMALASKHKRHGPEILKRATLQTHTKWSDFVQCLAKEYPLKHPLNKSAKDGMNKRIARAKLSAKRKRLGDKPPVNVFAASLV